MNDGGAAFPEVSTRDANRYPNSGPYQADIYSSGGMSLRDYFAAKAMHAFLTTAHEDISGDAMSNPKKCAVWAYEQADAMLAERATEGK